MNKESSVKGDINRSTRRRQFFSFDYQFLFNIFETQSALTFTHIDTITQTHTVPQP